LRANFGNQIRVGAPEIRSHCGVSIEEPHMGLRVRCLRGHFAVVRADLASRGALIVEAELTGRSGLVRATKPLARLLGYSQCLAQLTEGTAHGVLWLSHYAPKRTSPPEYDALWHSSGGSAEEQQSVPRSDRG
jgi:translation elongation factor EF-G